MLNRFSDLWTMGRATVAEGQSLMLWLREAGFNRLGVCGISMGGHMAARIGALSQEPVAIAACVAPHSAAAVFTEGILKNYLAWDILNRRLDGSGSAVDFMRNILSLTDIRNYPLPARPDAAFLVAASKDAYIPPESVSILHRHWPGSNLRWLDTGHVGAFLFHRRDFLEAAIQAFSRLEVPCHG
jgi:pimeloyl-ACP methyl ester carboxylesterase